MKTKLRFTLRSLFVFVALVGVWLGIQINWLKQRRDYLAQHPEVLQLHDPVDPVTTAPDLMWIWGERGQTRLRFELADFRSNSKAYNSLPPQQAIEIRRLFPEAIVQVLEAIPTSQNPDGSWRRVLSYAWYPGLPWNWGLYNSHD